MGIGVIGKAPSFSVFWLYKKSIPFGTSLCDITDLETELASTFFLQMFFNFVV
jgi:hypothetical protein